MSPYDTFRKSLLPLAGAVLVGGLVFQVRGMAAARTEPRTESTTSRSARLHAEGRMVTYPGGEVTVGSNLAATVAKVLVHEEKLVHKGELLIELDGREHEAALAEARARAKEAQADVQYFTSEAERSATLASNRVTSQAELDRSVHARDSAKARGMAAAATAQRLSAVLDQTRVAAPIDGVVLMRAAEPGQAVTPGTPLVTIADVSRLRVESEIDEFDLGRVAIGAPVVVRAEGYGDSTWKGHVEEIPSAVSQRKLKPHDPAKPTDARVLLVKVALDEPVPLKLGQRVEVEM
jgi:HlyD family secretion protein